ncbi:MAG: hypothetical protein MRY63_03485 [Neomegalonema sp.]|nr:hypothetical protein [Neomegalonema sp.]
MQQGPQIDPENSEILTLMAMVLVLNGVALVLSLLIGVWLGRTPGAEIFALVHVPMLMAFLLVRPDDAFDGDWPEVMVSMLSAAAWYCLLILPCLALFCIGALVFEPLGLAASLLLMPMLGTLRRWDPYLAP